MKLISLLKNLLSIQELRNKITYTLILTGVYVFLSYVIMPGIIIQENIRDYHPYISIAPLGLLPYVYSTVLVVFFTQSKRKLRVYSWVVALLYTILQGSSMFSMFGYTNVLSPGISIYLYLFLSLVGTSLCIFIAEKITEKGICDGRDLLMAVSVIVYLPKTIAEQFLERLDKNHLPLFVLDLLLIFLSLGIAIFIHQTFIRVPIKAAIEEDPENTSEANKHILIKLNAVADFPINFSIAIQILALRVVYFYNDASNSWFYSDLVQSLFLFGVTFLFTFLYTTRYITPETIKKEFLALTTSFRIEEGKQPYSERNVVVKEASYEKLLLRATFINACFLGFLAILPIILPKLGFSKELAGLVGAASIIFIVNAVSGALYNIDQYLYKYDFETIEDIAGSDFVGKEVFYLPEDSE